MKVNSLFGVLGFILALFLDSVWGAIDCFTCSSRNGSNPHCDDPMSPAFIPLDKRCVVPKENHVGMFPGNFCIKLTGTSYATQETLVVRTCSLEDMNSQCGTLKFQEDVLKGCLLTCNFDGCNRAGSMTGNTTFMRLLGPILLGVITSQLQ
ncbi:U-scoloptoxin(05)-Sm1a-like [Tigriopus californicus]|uniref:U-scoloptoxin(05)-Sm1a-like n=1 Tax=Tigriopus californicus TaxID=6832 RepID=UPI0027DA79CE|nr:U-scoloptoxin(05)-Sm1a-like [Tigriopus californicus]